MNPRTLSWVLGAGLVWMLVGCGAADGTDRGKDGADENQTQFDAGSEQPADLDGSDPPVDAGGQADDSAVDADSGADTGSPDGGDQTDESDAGQISDGGGDTGGDEMPADEGAPGDTAPNPDADISDLSRGLQWVRTNPMFISGLVVRMGPPPVAFVNNYFNDFHANAVHLWILGMGPSMDGWAAVGNPAYRYVSWTLKNGTSENGLLVGGYPANAPGRIGYQVHDEPQTWQDTYDMEVGFKAIREHDPEALFIANYSYQADDLEGMVSYFCDTIGGDIISYDCYSRSTNVYQHYDGFRQKARRCGVPYWRYINAYYDPNGDSEPISESDMRWDAFAGLVYGYTGHTWFLYQVNAPQELLTALFVNTNDFNSPKRPEWTWAAQINLEMANLGRAITQLTSTDVCYVPTLGVVQPDGTRKCKPGIGGDPYIEEIDPDGWDFEALAGFFVDNQGEHYVMVQNPRHSHGSWPIDESDSGTIELFFDFSGAPDNVDRSRVLSLNKMTGQVESIPMTRVDGNDCRLDVRLNAGDPFLFKYATGAPFALGP